MIEQYISEILPQKSKNTIVNQKQQLAWWNSYLGHSLLQDISPSVIAEYRDKLVKQQKSNSTLRRYLSVLSHMYTIGIREWNWIEDNPVLKVSKPKEPRGRVRFLSEEERERLLKSCKKSKNAHLYTVVVLALSTGGRKNELLFLQWKDIDFKRLARNTLETIELGECLNTCGADLVSVSEDINTTTAAGKLVFR